MTREVTVKVKCETCGLKITLKATSHQVGVIALRNSGWIWDKKRGWFCGKGCQEGGK